MAALRGSHRPPPKTRRGRPSIHDETWKKVSVVLMERQIARLDRVVEHIQKVNGHPITRAGVIRALVDAVFDSGVDIATYRSELEMRQRIAKRLKHTRGS